MAQQKKVNSVLIAGGGIIALGILCKKGILPAIKIPLPFGLSIDICGLFEPPAFDLDFGMTIGGTGTSEQKAIIVERLEKLASGGAISINGNIPTGASVPRKVLRPGTRLTSRGCYDAAGKYTPPGYYLGTVKEVIIDAAKGKMRYKVEDGPQVYDGYTYSIIDWDCVQDPELEIIL